MLNPANYFSAETGAEKISNHDLLLARHTHTRTHNRGSCSAASTSKEISTKNGNKDKEVQVENIRA
jgi:hypothetical protein